MKIYYMRDNHTFLILPLSADDAIDKLRAEFAEGWTCGMVCCHAIKENVHSKGTEHWDEFERAVREYFEHVKTALAISKETITEPTIDQYKTWLREAEERETEKDARIADLEATLLAARRAIDTAVHSYTESLKERDAALAGVERLREALDWYRQQVADLALTPADDDGPHVFHAKTEIAFEAHQALIADAGKRAALEPSKTS